MANAVRPQLRREATAEDVRVAYRAARAPWPLRILDRTTMNAIRLDINGPSYRQHVAQERANKRGTKLPDDRPDPDSDPDRR